ncbi:SgcJ/EcaC family oxidoreductase [Herbiconiux sp. P17]|uniref:YybH family protein n=1 Tax=Herbiconiux wuyangfengii TaxID=3342794 RepID=UPI0035BA2EFA
MSNPTAGFEIAGIEAMDTADQEAITALVGQMFIAFAQRSVDLLDGVYTDETDWINAFGSVKTGSAAIIDYLRGLFKDGNFDQGRVVTGPDCSLRRLDGDNVVVIAHLQIAGQGLVGGGEITLRDNRSVHVISRQPDGAWRIVTQMFQDARTDTSYINHS